MLKRHLRGRLPSPGIALAFIALVAALSGTAVALPGKNSVDSGDLKKGAVKTGDIARGAVTNAKVRNGTLTGAKLRNGTLTGAKLRNGTLTGAKVADNSLTGAKIDESTLGQVPSANTANTANSANSAANASAVAGRTPFLVKLGLGQSQTIATHGTVSLIAECSSNIGNDRIRILAATTQDGAAMGGDVDSYTGAPGDTLNAGTAADDRELTVFEVAAGTTEVNWNIDNGWVMDPTGKTLGLDGETTPLGLNFAGATCVASGVVNASG